MNEREGAFDAKVAVEYQAGETLSLNDTDAAADVYVNRPVNTPLSTAETHATLNVVTDDGRVTVELNGETLDALADALYRTQQSHANAE